MSPAAWAVPRCLLAGYINGGAGRCKQRTRDLASQGSTGDRQDGSDRLVHPRPAGRRVCQLGRPLWHHWRLVHRVQPELYPLFNAEARAARVLFDGLAPQSRSPAQRGRHMCHVQCGAGRHLLGHRRQELQHRRQHRAVELEDVGLAGLCRPAGGTHMHQHRQSAHARGR